MRNRISVTVSPPVRRRLRAVIADRNAAQKHVWRAQIVLLSADGVGTNAIMRQTGKSKTCVWRWQQRFMEEGFDGLLRDKTRRSRIARLGAEVAKGVVDLTLGEPPGEATYWTADMMAKQTEISVSSVQRIWRAHGCSRTGCGSSSSPPIPSSSTNCAMWSGFMSIRLAHAIVLSIDEKRSHGEWIATDALAE